MLNACSKEAPRVRKCYKPILHRFRLTAGPRPGGRPRRGTRRRPPARAVPASAVTLSRGFSHRRASTPGTLCPLTSTSGHDVTL